jgi:hypothetical protein
LYLQRRDIHPVPLLVLVQIPEYHFPIPY